jgi:hypothetical protein
MLGPSNSGRNRQGSSKLPENAENQDEIHRRLSDKKLEKLLNQLLMRHPPMSATLRALRPTSKSIGRSLLGADKF